jgi:hypothetical protein
MRTGYFADVRLAKDYGYWKVQKQNNGCITLSVSAVAKKCGRWEAIHRQQPPSTATMANVKRCVEYLM